MTKRKIPTKASDVMSQNLVKDRISDIRVFHKSTKMAILALFVNFIVNFIVNFVFPYICSFLLQLQHMRLINVILDISGCNFKAPDFIGPVPF